MMEFDVFTMQLFEEAKAFFEKFKECREDTAKDAYLHASVLLAISALEASINSIASELLVDDYQDQYPLQEQALLLEKDIKFDGGEFVLGSTLKMARMTDRIEFLYHKFTGEKLTGDTVWYMKLKQSIDLRNKLVHPKEHIKITESQVESAICSVIEAVNELYLAIYKKEFPIYNRGLVSKIELS